VTTCEHVGERERPLILNLKIDMAIVGQFHITGSFKLTGRGLVAMGQLTEGKVRDGDRLTLDMGFSMLTIRIRGVDMGGSASTRSSFVGLTFVW
jgi:hypothetical protein